MTPLSLIKYLVDHFQGTSYEPWINALLFMAFAAAVWAAVSLLLGRGGRTFIVKAASAATKSLKVRRGYSPEWERFRLRIEPYVDLINSLYFAFIGLYSATLVGLAIVLAREKTAWWALLIGLIWVLASFFYMRINLEAASWAYHKLKRQRR